MRDEKSSSNIEELASILVAHISERGIVNAKDLSSYIAHFPNGETAEFNDIIKYCHEKGVITLLYARKASNESPLLEETYYTAPRRKKDQ